MNLDPTDLELLGMESGTDAIDALVFQTATGERIRLEGEMHIVDAFED